MTARTRPMTTIPRGRATGETTRATGASADEADAPVTTTVIYKGALGAEDQWACDGKDVSFEGSDYVDANDERVRPAIVEGVCP